MKKQINSIKIQKKTKQKNFEGAIFKFPSAFLSRKGYVQSLCCEYQFSFILKL